MCGTAAPGCGFPRYTAGGGCATFPRLYSLLFNGSLAGFLIGLAFGGLMTVVAFSQTMRDILHSAAPLNVWFDALHTIHLGKQGNPQRSRDAHELKEEGHS